MYKIPANERSEPVFNLRARSSADPLAARIYPNGFLDFGPSVVPYIEHSRCGSARRYVVRFDKAAEKISTISTVRRNHCELAVHGSVGRPSPDDRRNKSESM